MDGKQIDQCNVCAQCIGNSYLKDETLKHGVVETCSYCENRSRTISINELANKVRRVVEQCYHRTPYEPDGLELYLTKSGDEWVRKGIPVVHLICDLLESSEKIATDIQVILEECTEDPDLSRAFVEHPFSVDAHYEEKEEIGDDRYSSAYEEFERRIKEESRFFSQFIRTTLASVFDDLASLPTLDEQPLLITSGPGQRYSSFYRARVFQDPSALRQR